MENNKTAGKMERVFVRLISSWIFALTAVAILDSGDIKAKEFGLNLIPEGLAIAAVFFIIVSLVVYLPQIREKADYAVLLVVSFFAALNFVLLIDDFIFCAFLIAVLTAVTLFCFGEGRLGIPERELNGRYVISIVIAAALFSALFIGVFTIYRYLSFNASNFDFGIFVNMFHNMRERLLPLVTSERDGLLSHFAVHISPAYYLLLPFYAIFPYAETLLVLQAAIIVSGVIPLWLIIKKYRLSNYALTFICTAYVLYPALTGGAFYDFHENKMLTALILWTFYFYEKRKLPLFYVFALLVCMVKEDAPIYIAIIGLYLLLAKKEYKHGAALFFGSVAYFAGVIAILDSFGLGAMTWRYNNISDSGFFGIIKAVILNPARIIYECADGKKLLFLFQMMLPLLFMPVITKKISRYILLIPMILINLMPDYGYQHSIYFQYTYGVSALLFYLTVINLADIKGKPRSLLPLGIMLSTILVYASSMSVKTTYYRAYVNTADTRAAINEVLGLVPEDASVTASTFLLPHMANRDVIYQYKSGNHTQYIVLDLRGMSAESIEDEFAAVEEGGYTLVNVKESIIALFIENDG